MNRLIRASIALCAVAVVGCNPRMYSFTPASAAPLTPKAATCDFSVVSGTPKAEYEEIGTLNVGTPSWVTGDNASFKDAIRQEVCQAGGDLVVADVNGRGSIVRGTVFRKTAGAPAKAP